MAERTTVIYPNPQILAEAVAARTLLTITDLLAELNRTRVDVAVTGEKNDRERNAAASHLMLSLNPAHARHAHVEHHAARLRRGIAREEVLCPPVGDRFPSFHIQHEAQGFAQIRFIVHNAH